MKKPLVFLIAFLAASCGWFPNGGPIPAPTYQVPHLERYVLDTDCTLDLNDQSCTCTKSQIEYPAGSGKQEEFRRCRLKGNP